MEIVRFVRFECVYVSACDRLVCKEKKKKIAEHMLFLPCALLFDQQLSECVGHIAFAEHTHMHTRNHVLIECNRRLLLLPLSPCLCVWCFVRLSVNSAERKTTTCSNACACSQAFRISWKHRLSCADFKRKKKKIKTKRTFFYSVALINSKRL